VKVLVMAKAPVPGQAKTRLGTSVGHEAAADLAAAALLDTLAAARAAVTGVGGELRGRLMISLAGDLGAAARASDLRSALAGWQVVAQRGDGFAERLVSAHHDAGDETVVQIGMDTPHVTATMLRAAATRLTGHDAVLGPATDGGWWVLARRASSVVEPLRGVEMSTPTTGPDTRAALEAAGHTVRHTDTLDDVDTVDDAHRVATLAPHTRFARQWHRLRGVR
jgi:uncharacterized protein